MHSFSVPTPSPMPNPMVFCYRNLANLIRCFAPKGSNPKKLCLGFFPSAGQIFKKWAKAVMAKVGRTDDGSLPTSNGIPATMTGHHGTASIATFAPEWSPQPSKGCVQE